MVTRLQYLERYLRCADFLSMGRTGAICEDQGLVFDYRPEFYGVFENHLRGNNPRIKAETILLLAKLNERAAEPLVRELWRSEGDLVSSACLSYIKALGDSDSLLDGLLVSIERGNPKEQLAAAGKLATHATAEDIPRIRKAYGRSQGEAKKAMAKALTKISQKSPETAGTVDLILSDPVFPDEKKFRAFAAKSKEYMDVRYRENVHPDGRISAKLHNNVASAIGKVRVRLYNEYDNLDFYDEESESLYFELADLAAWVSEDLSSKTVYGLRDESLRSPMVCSVCDCVLVRNPSGNLACPGCGRTQGH